MIFYIFLEYPVIKLQAKKIKLNLLFTLSYLCSHFALMYLTLGYLNPPSNNPALAVYNLSPLLPSPPPPHPPTGDF